MLQLPILAPTLEVANNSFGPAKDMVLYEEKGEDGEGYSELADLVHVQTHIKTLTHREMNSTLKVIAADANTAAGKKSVGILIEELWLFGKQANAKDMLREATGGLASRPEGFTIYITTQSDEPPEGVFKEKLQYARDVRDGKILDPQFLPILFEHPPEMVKSGEAKQLQNLPMVNPNLGYSVDRAYLEREYRKAEAEGEASLKGFLAKYGNVEVGLNLRSDRWAGADFWETAAIPVFSLEELLGSRHRAGQGCVAAAVRRGAQRCCCLLGGLPQCSGGRPRKKLLSATVAYFQPSPEVAEGCEPEDYWEDPVEVWPENAEPLALFVSLQTQWAWVVGMGGGGRIGLRYEAVYPLLNRVAEGDQELWDRLFADVRAMEMAVLQIPQKRSWSSANIVLQLT